MKTPVVLIIFQRPEATQQVLETIRQAKPPQLFVIADGPRPNRPGEAERCAATRALIDQVDWECEVKTNYADTNLGLAKRVSSGLNWVFDQVEDAIILEDDCLVHPSFFRFCDEMLERYRNDTRIFSISGYNPIFQHQPEENHSYRFSRYHHYWGWATWRRAWQHFQFDLSYWKEVEEQQLLQKIFQDDWAAFSWENLYQDVCDGRLDSWATRWVFSCFFQNSLSIHPCVNLVKNIGFDEVATHTRTQIGDATPVEALTFPLRHPAFVVRDSQADDFEQKHMYNLSPYFWVRKKAKRLLKRLFPQPQMTPKALHQH